MSRIMKCAVVMLSLLLIMSACEKKEAFVRIGIAGQMTGPQAKLGADLRQGVMTAVEEWNGKGGVLGKKIEVIVGDDQADPKQAVSVANKLVNDGVVGVIGHYNSSCSIPASDIYNRAGIPMISHASTNPLFTERGYKNVFRVCGRDDQQGGVAADFVNKKLGAKKVAILHDKTTYGQGIAEEFKKSLGGTTDVVYFNGITQGDKDFKPVLSAIKDKKAELIYFGGMYSEGGLIVKQAKELNMAVSFLSCDGTFDPKFVEIAGEKAAEGSFFTFGPDQRNIPAAKGFIKTYTAKYGEPGPYAIYAYSAVTALLTAIRDAGTTESAKVIDKLHTTEFSLPLGNLRFNEKGDVSQSPFVVWMTKGGKFEEYWKPY